MKDFRRKIITNFRAIGRRFVAGDIVEKEEDAFRHYYINENKDGIDLIESSSNNIDSEHYEIILDESQDI